VLKKGGKVMSILVIEVDGDAGVVLKDEANELGLSSALKQAVVVSGDMESKEVVCASALKASSEFKQPSLGSLPRLVL
jgi:hypothetical protein